MPTADAVLLLFDSRRSAGSYRRNRSSINQQPNQSGHGDQKQREQDKRQLFHRAVPLNKSTAMIIDLLPFISTPPPEIYFIIKPVTPYI
jgi:hypothetical protein